jgi:hypothetical protein
MEGGLAVIFDHEIAVSSGSIGGGVGIRTESAAVSW